MESEQKTSSKIKRIAQLINGREILSSFGEIILRLKNSISTDFFK